jgi:polysaccharide pyruvyl transferase WcaK-like protein
MFVTWQWIILIALAILGAVATIHYQRKAEAVAQTLSAEDRLTFNNRYLNRGDRKDMPARFNDLAAATDRVRGARTGATVVIAIALLFFVI